MILPRLKTKIFLLNRAPDDGGEEEKRNSGEEEEEETNPNRLEASKSSSFLGVKDFSFLDVGNGNDGGGEGDAVVPQAAHKKSESPRSE